MTNDTNKPIAVLRDGALKVSIFAHPGEKGTRYSATLIRSYRDANGVWHDTSYLANGEYLRGARLLGLAYDYVIQLRATDGKPRVEDEAE